MHVEIDGIGGNTAGRILHGDVAGLVGIPPGLVSLHEVEGDKLVAVRALGAGNLLIRGILWHGFTKAPGVSHAFDLRQGDANHIVSAAGDCGAIGTGIAPLGLFQASGGEGDCLGVLDIPHLILGGVAAIVVAVVAAVQNGGINIVHNRRASRFFGFCDNLINRLVVLGHRIGFVAICDVFGIRHGAEGAAGDGCGTGVGLCAIGGIPRFACCCYQRLNLSRTVHLHSGVLTGNAGVAADFN